MGISCLLPVLKSITETKTIDEYRGQTLAIDGYCWLHRAIYSCSQDICLGHTTDKYVTYFMDRINTLLHHNVAPYVVFDGGPLPMKKNTEDERRKIRQNNRVLGIQHYNNRRFSEARKCFIRAADVSPYMAHQVIQQLKARKIAYVVAPYEADAQLAYLVRNGLADGVITEDSDCLPFGCQTVLFKMDRDNVVQEIKMSNLKKNKGLSFHMFTEQMFLEMCIFSGCDYLRSISGFGLKKAYAAIKQHGSCTKIIRALRLEGKIRVPATYEDNFRKAVLTFRHQRVFCPTKKRMVPLTPIPAALLEADPAMDFVGPLLSSAVAIAIANGDMDPISKSLFPAPIPRPHCNLIQPKTANPKYKLPAALRPKESITSFFCALKSAATVACNDPRKSPILTKRKFSSRLKDKWTSNSEPNKKLTARPTASDVVANPDADSPQMTSRFFGVNHMMSPPDEMTKKSVPRTLNSSTLQSPDPCGVDSARVLPSEDLKENQAPNCQEAPISSFASPVKETAFSRMMRAGSMLRHYKLKTRKPTGIAIQSRRQLHAPFSNRIGRFAFNGNKTTKLTRVSDKTFESRVELMAKAKRSCDCCDDPSHSPITSKIELSKPADPSLEELQEDIDATHVQPSNVPTTSFNLFRFKH